MSWSDQQRVPETQISPGDEGQWQNYPEGPANYPEASSYSYGSYHPQTESMEYETRPKAQSRVPFSYDYHGPESPRSNLNDKHDPFNPPRTIGSHEGQTDHQYGPYGPPNLQDQTVPFGYGSEARGDYNVGTYDYAQGQAYQTQAVQRPGMDELQQQHQFNPLDNYGAGTDSYAPYPAYGPYTTPGPGMEETQRPQVALQNVETGTFKQDSGLLPMRDGARGGFGVDESSTSLTRSDTLDWATFAASTGLGPAQLSSELRSPELISSSALPPSQNNSASSERKSSALAELPHTEAPAPGMQQEERARSSGSGNEPIHGPALPLVDENHHASAQPSTEQRARWEFLRSLVRQHDHADKDDRQEGRRFGGSTNSSPKARQNQFQPGPMPARSSSKAMRTLMLPQMVESRKSIDASSGGQNPLVAQNQGHGEPPGPPLPPRPQAAPSGPSQHGRSASQPSTGNAPLSSAPPARPPMSNTLSHQAISRPSTPSRPPTAASTHPVASGGPHGPVASIPPTSHSVPAIAQNLQHSQIPPQTQGQQQTSEPTRAIPSTPPALPKAAHGTAQGSNCPQRPQTPASYTLPPAAAHSAHSAPPSQTKVAAPAPHPQNHPSPRPASTPGQHIPSVDPHPPTAALNHPTGRGQSQAVSQKAVPVLSRPPQPSNAPGPPTSKAQTPNHPLPAAVPNPPAKQNPPHPATAAPQSKQAPKAPLRPAQPAAAPAQHATQSHQVERGTPALPQPRKPAAIAAAASHPTATPPRGLAAPHPLAPHPTAPHPAAPHPTAPHPAAPHPAAPHPAAPHPAAPHPAAPHPAAPHPAAPHPPASHPAAKPSSSNSATGAHPATRALTPVPHPPPQVHAAQPSPKPPQAPAKAPAAPQKAAKIPSRAPPASAAHPAPAPNTPQQNTKAVPPHKAPTHSPQSGTQVAGKQNTGSTHLSTPHTNPTARTGSASHPAPAAHPSPARQPAVTHSQAAHPAASHPPNSHPAAVHPPTTRAAPTSHSTPAPHNPTKPGASSHPPPAPHPASQPKPASHTPAPPHTPTPQRVPIPPHPSAPQHPPAAQHTSTPQHAPAPQHPSVPNHAPVARHTPIPQHTPVPRHTPALEHTPVGSHVNQSQHTTPGRGLPANHAPMVPRQTPTRKNGSLGRSGAVARQNTPQGVTGAPGARQHAPPRQIINPGPHSPARPTSPSQDQQEEYQDPDVMSPDYEDDEYSAEEREIQLSETLPGVLGQLAGGEEPDGEVDLEQEADNLVHLFLYGIALVFKSLVEDVAEGDGWGHIEEVYSKL